MTDPKLLYLSYPGIDKLGLEGTRKNIQDFYNIGTIDLIDYGFPRDFNYETKKEQEQQRDKKRARLTKPKRKDQIRIPEGEEAMRLEPTESERRDIYGQRLSNIEILIARSDAMLLFSENSYLTPNEYCEALMAKKHGLNIFYLNPNHHHAEDFWKINFVDQEFFHREHLLGFLGSWAGYIVREDK